MAAAPGAPRPAPLPSGKGPGKGGARNSAPGPSFKGGLFNPSQQLSGQSLSQAATDIANAQTQGPISELAKQIASLNGQGSAAQSQTFGYYMQLAKEAQDAVNQEKSIGSGLNSQLQGIGQDTSGQLARFGQQAQGGALGRLSALGLGGDQQAQLQGETARQQGLGALDSGTFRSAGATQGANYAGNAASNLGTFALRGQERLGNIAQATRLSEVPLTSKIAALQAQRGALYGTALGQLRSQERNYQVAQEGLGIRQAGLQQTAANNQARNRLTARGQDLTARGQNITQQNNLANQALRQWQNNPNAVGSPAWARVTKTQAARNGGVLPAPRQLGFSNELDVLAGKVQSAQRVGYSKQDVMNALGSGFDRKGNGGKGAKVHPYPSWMVEAAYELLGWGHVLPSTAAQMHSLGLRNTFFRGKPIAVGGIPQPSLTQTLQGAANSVGSF